MSTQDELRFDQRSDSSDKLITASAKTLNWLTVIKFKLAEKNPKIMYRASKYYALFKSPETHRNVAYLQVQPNQIRLFTKLPPFFDNDLELTPSTGTWAEYLPSLFTIRSKNSLEKGIELILKTYNYDLNS